MDVLARYKQKVEDFCEGIDPYTLQKENSPLPRNVGYFDICNYCIGKDSAYSHESFKAYKTLEAYEYYENGWVQSVNCKNITSGYIVVAKVKHSYRLNLKAVQCWVAIDGNGIILTGHCDCMAGLGEVCRHVGAILFVLEAWGRKATEIECAESISCTDVLAKWLVPKMKSVDMAAVDDICWSSGTTDVFMNDTTVASLNVSLAMNNSIVTQDDSLTTETVQDIEVEVEIDKLLLKMKAGGASCPLMSIRNPFAVNFVPKKQEEFLSDLTTNAAEEDLSVIRLYLTSFYERTYESLPLEVLQALAEDVKLEYSQEEVDLIEKQTREQSSCTLWYRFRAGRVTGSVFKAACRTSIITPALGTIEKICFPERHIFTSKPTEYGKRNEALARDTFFKATSSVHSNYELKTTGLIINNKYPFCGVSPDAIVTCDCCGKGVVEIKCPYLMRFGDVKTYLKKKDCPLIAEDNNSGSEYSLKRGHEYYYQVQMEIFLCEVDYCDFVVWNPKSFIKIRVYKDEAFWNEKYAVASDFFCKVLMPELYACYYTRKMKKPKEPK